MKPETISEQMYLISKQLSLKTKKLENVSKCRVKNLNNKNWGEIPDIINDMQHLFKAYQLGKTLLLDIGEDILVDDVIKKHKHLMPNGFNVFFLKHSEC